MPVARFRLDEKVAVVTGGGSGIGAAICRAYAERGARVVVADVNPAGGQRVADELGEAGWFHAVDVTDLASVEAGVAAAVEGFGERYHADTKEQTIQELHARQPIGRMGRPEEVADLAVYLATDEAGFMTGSAVVLDGGWTAQ